MAHLYFLRSGFGNINVGLGTRTTTKSSCIVKPGGNVIEKLRAMPIDSVRTVATPLRSYFSDLSIGQFTRLTMSSDVIGGSAPLSSTNAEIFKRLILHGIVARLVAGSFLLTKSISIGSSSVSSSPSDSDMSVTGFLYFLESD